MLEDFITLVDDTMGLAAYGYPDLHKIREKKDAIQEVKSSRKGVKKDVVEEEDDEDEHSFFHDLLHKAKDDKHIVKTKCDDSSGKRVESARFGKLFPRHVDSEKKRTCGEGHHYDNDCDGLE